MFINETNQDFKPSKFKAKRCDCLLYTSLAAALGRRRDESLDDLAALKFGIRSDKEGELLKDFHMVLKDKKTSYVTTRYYLADAIFLVGLESQDENFLKMLDDALQAPVFPLFLGRRSCPPTLPLSLGIRQTDLLTALQEEPWHCLLYTSG